MEQSLGWREGVALRKVSHTRPCSVLPSLGTWTESRQEGPVGHSSHPSMLGHHSRGVPKMMSCPPALAISPTQGNAVHMYTLKE